jgi:hypothetical protein
MVRIPPLRYCVLVSALALSIASVDVTGTSRAAAPGARTFGPGGASATGSAAGPTTDPDSPSCVLLRRSKRRLPRGQSGDVLVAADPGRDAVARRVTLAFADPAGAPSLALRLHRLVQDRVARDPSTPDSVRAVLEEPTYLFLSDRQGGFPGRTFWREQPNGSLRAMPGVPFVDMPVGETDLDWSRFGGFAEIFPHELAHIMMRELAGDATRKASNAIHFVTVRTDPWMAFTEGWGEHFQPVALDLGPGSAARELRARPPYAADSGWLARFAREQARGSWFRPANLAFLFWQGKGEQQLRDGAVRGNCFIHLVPLPRELQDGRRAARETMLYRDVVPPAEVAPLKNGPQVMASEGIVSTFFYRLVTDRRLQETYRESAFYESFLAAGEAPLRAPAEVRRRFPPLVNVYLKLFEVFHHDVTWEVGTGRPPLLQVVAGYAARYPDEAEAIFAIFLDVTRGVSVDREAARRQAEPGYLEDLRKRLLCGEARLDGNLGPPLWLLNRQFRGGFGVFRYFFLRPPLTFDLNAADAADLRTVPGVTVELADRIVAVRETRGFYRSIDDLAGVPGFTPALTARFQGMRTAMERMLDRPLGHDDDSKFAGLLVPMLFGSYAVAALWQVGRALVLAALAFALVGGLNEILETRGSGGERDRGRGSRRTEAGASGPGRNAWRWGARAVRLGLGVAAGVWIFSLALYLCGVYPTALLMGAIGLAAWVPPVAMRLTRGGPGQAGARPVVLRIISRVVVFVIIGAMY